jgi:phage shock protein PspC (stress-responsive transcriptional regulator)
MKKSIRIHIGGYFFNIDEEAYKILEIWLQKIQLILTGKDSYNEIIEDIESGIAEHFRDSAPDETFCLSTEDVEKTIKIMGYPEDFDDNENKSAGKEAEQHFAFDSDETKRHRRLYRNPDERMLGGVCSGLGNFFNIDPIIIRLIFVVAVIFWGTGTLIYLILWVVMPVAKTATQKLEMKGRRVNISNIEKNIRNEFDAVRTGFFKWTKTEQYGNLTNGLESILFALVKVIKIVLKIIVILLGALMIFIGLVVFFAFSTLLIAGDSIPYKIDGTNNNISIHAFVQLLPMHISYFTIALALLLTVGIPFLMVAYSGARIIFNFKRKFRIFEFSALGLWIIGIAASFYIVIQTVLHFKQQNSETKSYILKPTKSDTLFVEISKNYDPDFDFSDVKFSSFYFKKSISENKLFGRPQLDIKKSSGTETKINVIYKSSGETREAAARKCKTLSYDWLQTDSLLSFNSYFVILPKENFYNQQVEIEIMLPVGKAVHLGELTETVIYDIENIEDEWDGNMVGKTWIMTENGLTRAGLKDSVKIQNNQKSGNGKLKDMNEELKNM